MYVEFLYWDYVKTTAILVLFQCNGGIPILRGIGVPCRTTFSDVPFFNQYFQVLSIFL